MAAVLCIRFFDTDLPNGPVVTTRRLTRLCLVLTPRLPTPATLLYLHAPPLTHIPRPTEWRNATAQEGGRPQDPVSAHAVDLSNRVSDATGPDT
jgi:hypothetical protein